MKALIAMSGGVDSSAAALLLQKQATKQFLPCWMHGRTRSHRALPAWCTSSTRSSF